MPRAIWSGAISFGLVNVPVRMYSAVTEQDLRFHYVHAKDGGRIGYEKICKLEEEPVPDDEIVKGFEVDEGEWVYMTDDDFEAAEADGHRVVEIHDFVPYEEIDPIYFERTYYLGPDAGAERVYTLLRTAMEESGLAAVTTYVMRDRQHLGCLRVREGVITLERMYFADEIRPADELAPDAAKVDKRELEMARELIDRFSGSFEPERYEDTYRARLLEIIEAKREGREIQVAAERPAEEPEDLMSALRASIEAAQRRREGAQRPSSNGGLARLSKDDLLERARKADVPGRSRMSKKELVEALERK
jgi:DNA end-binding protein Ku